MISISKTKSAIFTLFSLLAIILLTACGPQKKVELKYKQLSVESSLVIEKDTYQLGEPIEMNFVVRNNDADDKQIYLLGKDKCVFTVYNEGNDIIWQNIEMNSDNSELTLFTIPGMFEKDFSAIWDGTDLVGEQVKLGTYSIEAKIPTADNLKGYKDIRKVNIIE